MKILTYKPLQRELQCSDPQHQWPQNWNRNQPQLWHQVPWQHWDYAWFCFSNFRIHCQSPIRVWFRNDHGGLEKRLRDHRDVRNVKILDGLCGNLEILGLVNGGHYKRNLIEVDHNWHLLKDLQIYLELHLAWFLLIKRRTLNIVRVWPKEKRFFFCESQMIMVVGKFVIILFSRPCKIIYQRIF